MPWPYGGVVEFLALTGQRREEAAQARPGEIDAEARTWCISADRTKNRKAHIVHLSEPAWAVVSGHLSGEYIFSTSSGHYFQAYSQSKRLLDELSGIRGWRLHDLRRTIVSGMARVADKILNHQSGTISGVAAVYQRHDFLAERKNALDRWGGHVAELVRQFQA
jgi:integrase